MTDHPAEALPDAPGRTPRWVTVLAIVNVVWIVVALLMLASGTYLALFGFFLLPQTFLLMGYPVVFLIISLLAIAAAVLLAVWRARPGQRLRAVWMYGTVILSAALAIGAIGTLIVFGTRL